jgi:hypothetical protein
MKRDNNKTTLLVFSRNEMDMQLIGFAIMQGREAAKAMKCIKLLYESNSSFYLDGFGEIQYQIEDFSIQHVTPSELETLARVFEFDYDDESRFGIFPDPINDALDNGLIEDE